MTNSINIDSIPCDQCLYCNVCSMKNDFLNAIYAIADCIVVLENGDAVFIKDMECVDSCLLKCKYYISDFIYGKEK